MREVIDRLGYRTHSGKNTDTVKKRLEWYGITTEHFHATKPTKRTPKNVFVSNSTAGQNTLRRWYKKGNYTQYVCSICGQEPVWMGKQLTLILDHINGNNRDDRLENLRWVCPNCNQQLETTNGKNLKRPVKIMPKNYCIDCNKEILQCSKRCTECMIRHKKLNSKKILVDRDELKRLVRSEPFEQVGREFGVSGNAVKKWCRSMNIPSRKIDIESYTVDEWMAV